MEYNILRSVKRKGFTLLELLIVIALIGILVSISVASYAQAQKKSRDARRQADLKAVQSAWEQYNADNNGSYPAACAISTAYLPVGMPADPKNLAPYVYTYRCSNVSYCFCADLESGTGNSASVPAGSVCSFGSGSYYCVGNLQ